jgi:hypothetical protein
MEKSLIMEIEIRRITNQFTKAVYEEVFIENKPLDMGEGAGEIIDGSCEHHGNTKFLSGYNQGGHDSVSVCLECCREIANKLLSKKMHDESVVQWAYRAGMAEVAAAFITDKNGVPMIENTPYVKFMREIINTDRTLEEINKRIDIIRGE